MSKDTKISSQFPAPSNRSKGGIHKRVVSVAIQDVQKLSLRGDHHISSPPSDSWAWRKYGQKPIKGSPYPRGYYKCSSSKGCPARKQVERSKVDPHMLLVTYSSDHNHPCPEYSANNHDSPNAVVNTGAMSVSEDESDEAEEEGEEGQVEDKKPKSKNLKSHDQLVSEETKFIMNDDNNNIDEGPLMADYAGEFGLFSDLESPSCTAAILDRCPLMTTRRDRISTDEEMAMVFTTTMVEEEEELIFSDLGELPECAAVFR